MASSRAGSALKSVPQPDARHAVELGEGLQNQQIPAAQQGLCGERSVVGQKNRGNIRPAKKRPAGGALLQDAGHKGGGRQLAGGVVGLAEEHHVHAVIDGAAEGLRHSEVVGLPQKIALHRAADRFQCGGIFRKGGGRDQRLAGALGPTSRKIRSAAPLPQRSCSAGTPSCAASFFPQGAAKKGRGSGPPWQGLR